MKDALRTLIVDDEPAARELLRILLQRMERVDVVGSCADGHAALATIQRTRPDLVLLDVRMPGLDGFTLLERLPRVERPGVVFVTAHADFALRAFGVHALDYLLKPVDEERLLEAVSRARELRQPAGWSRFQRRLDALFAARAQETAQEGWLLVRHGSARVPLRWEEIVWIEAAGNYARVHAAGQGFLLRASLAELEQRLEGLPFVRVHRGVLLNVMRIVSLRPVGHGDLEVRLADGERLAVSRRFRARLEGLLGSLG